MGPEGLKPFTTRCGLSPWGEGPLHHPYPRACVTCQGAGWVPLQPLPSLRPRPGSPRKEQRVGVVAPEAPGRWLSLPKASSRKQHRLRQAARQGRGLHSTRPGQGTETVRAVELRFKALSSRGLRQAAPPPASVRSKAGATAVTPFYQVIVGLGRSLAQD